MLSGTATNVKKFGLTVVMVAFEGFWYYRISSMVTCYTVSWCQLINKQFRETAITWR
jgi:hypothetical protein